MGFMEKLGSTLKKEFTGHCKTNINRNRGAYETEKDIKEADSFLAKAQLRQLEKNIKDKNKRR